MRKLVYLIVVLAALGLIIAGCLPTVPPTEQGGLGTLPNKSPGTIQDAIDAASPGDTIFVGPGTYYENLLIDKALTICSTDGAEVTIIDGVGFRYMVSIYSSNVTFEGFTVTNPSYAGGSDATGILVGAYLEESVSNVQILDNIITQIRSETGDQSMYGATGINIGRGPLSDIVISGNNITDIHNPDGLKVDHTCGINIWDGADNVLISNNEISDIKYNGIILEYASNVQIVENSITDCQVGIRVDPYEGVTVSDLTVNYNNLFGNTEYGVLNTMEYQIDATCNWWGDATGPYHETDNPLGTGNAVSDYVNYDPWIGKGIIDLITDVEDAGLGRGIEKSLLAKLNAAENALQRGRINAAINNLKAFIHEVEAQRGKKIPDTVADEWIDIANAKINCWLNAIPISN